MLTHSNPSTPGGQLSQTPVATPSPGTWRHPKFEEIAARQNAATFTNSHVKKIVWNGGVLLATYYLRDFTESYSNTYPSWIPPIPTTYTNYPTLALRLLLLFNILTALLPLYHRQDPLTDIPLTPTQRSLLGLDPSATPSSPLTHYVTPPRYPRSITPRSGTPGSRTGSPVSRKGSPRQASDSPFAPSPSPLWQSSVGILGDSSRRHSYGSPSPLGPGIGGKEGSLFGTPRTPSPSVGKGASVGLNNRWLYERGRVSPGRNIYS